MEIGIKYSTRFLEEKRMRNIASPILRLLAVATNAAVLFIPIVLFVSYILDISLTDFFGALLPGIAFLFFYPLFMAFLDAFLTSKFGGGVGKLLTGIKVVDIDGKNVSFFRAFLRDHIGYIISGTFFFLGFIWIFVDKERRAWHDQVAD